MKRDHQGARAPRRGEGKRGEGGGQVSEKQPWPGYTGWGPAVMLTGGILFFGLVLSLVNISSSSSLLGIVVLAVVSLALLVVGGVLVYQAQRAWVSQKGSEIATPKRDP